MRNLCPVTEPASGSLDCRFYLFSLAPFPSLVSFHLLVIQNYYCVTRWLDMIEKGGGKT